MFDYSNMKQKLTAAVGALILSATAVTAAVGPARAIETGPALYAQTEVAASNV